MKCLYVLYDSECELCLRCRDWSMKQAVYVPLVFIPLQSPEVPKRFPGIEAFSPGEQMLVISDEGEVYRGARAWITCLWAMRKYREHAQRLANPVLLPFARRVYELLSRNRFFLSDALFRQDPPDAARQLAAHYDLHKSNWQSCPS